MRNRIQAVLDIHLNGYVITRSPSDLLTDILSAVREGSDGGIRLASGQSALQMWVMDLTIMQQSVLISAVRGADGTEKFHRYKMLLRWYRRCVLVSAMDGRTLLTPDEPGGGSFTGPSTKMPSENPGRMHVYTPEEPAHWSVRMQPHVDDFMRSRDDLPSHYWTHCMHAFEILGYKHPNPEIRAFWHAIYIRMVHAMHLWPELEWQMDQRLGDTVAGWKAREDSAGSCSE